MKRGYKDGKEREKERRRKQRQQILDGRAPLRRDVEERRRR